MKMPIMVSVLCTTYNHEKYIADALESFIKQKTNFLYEVIVFDDASTDSTAEIIREYEKKYPELIKPIYQKENLYSKGVKKWPLYEQLTRGKYVAVCEGDDYWTNENKLQLQADYMEAHPECALCIHNAINVDINKKIIGHQNPCTEDRVITTEEIIVGGGGFCATNSIFTRSNLYFHRPDYFNILTLDYIIQIYLASMGTVYCFANEMSAYRRGVEGSWSRRMGKYSERWNRARHSQQVLEVLTAYDSETEYRYHKAIEEEKTAVEFNVYRYAGNIKVLKKKYRPYLKKMHILGHCKLAITIIDTLIRGKK